MDFSDKCNLTTSPYPDTDGLYNVKFSCSLIMKVITWHPLSLALNMFTVFVLTHLPEACDK